MFDDRSMSRRATTRRATLKLRAATFSTFSVGRRAATLIFPTWSTSSRRRNKPATTNDDVFMWLNDLLCGLGIVRVFVCMSVCTACWCCFCNNDPIWCMHILHITVVVWFRRNYVPYASDLHDIEVCNLHRAVMLNWQAFLSSLDHGDWKCVWVKNNCSSWYIYDSLLEVHRTLKLNLICQYIGVALSQLRLMYNLDATEQNTDCRVGMFVQIQCNVMPWFNFSLTTIYCSVNPGWSETWMWV